MSNISFTPIVDGTTGTASQVNTPLSTIYNDYNGNITDANIASAAAIAQSKISLALAGAKSAIVATSETTTSSSFTDLATPGPAVTVTIGASGMALVVVTAALANNTINDYPGSTTFTAKYEIITGGTATFADREISVIPL